MPYSVNPLNRLAGICLRKRGRRTLATAPRRACYWLVCLEPSVAQPPLPLQEFLPLQPLSLDLQPPLPLQEFWPLQACFSISFLSSCPRLQHGGKR